MTNLRFLLVVAASAGAVFADLPDIPKEAIARKKELLFSDDFQGCKGRLKSAAGGAEWRGGRKVQHLQIKKENVARYGTMGRYTP
jgi:hypothetical protein